MWVLERMDFEQVRNSPEQLMWKCLGEPDCRCELNELGFRGFLLIKGIGRSGYRTGVLFHAPASEYCIRNNSVKYNIHVKNLKLTHG